MRVFSDIHKAQQWAQGVGGRWQLQGPRAAYLAEMMDRKGRLSLAEASVVFTPLSMIMPACRGGRRQGSRWA